MQPRLNLRGAFSALRNMLLVMLIIEGGKERGQPISSYTFLHFLLSFSILSPSPKEKRFWRAQVQWSVYICPKVIQLVLGRTRSQSEASCVPGWRHLHGPVNGVWPGVPWAWLVSLSPHLQIKAVWYFQPGGSGETEPCLRLRCVFKADVQCHMLRSSRCFYSTLSGRILPQHIGQRRIISIGFGLPE